MNCADLLVASLRSLGVDFVTTLSGNGLNPLFEAARRVDLRLVDFRNEQAAAYAADAAARLTGRLAVCAVSSGIAHVNALAGVLNAWYDGAPVLLISGASDHSRTGQGKFQDLDQVALAAPICKYAALVDRPERLLFHLREAVARATSGRPGPVHLTIPADVLLADASSALVGPVFGAAEAVVRPSGEPDSGAVSEVVWLIGQSERPVIVAGSGAFYAHADEALEALASSLAIPVVVPIWDRGAVARPAPHFLGVVGAASGEPRLVADADLLILVGARVDYRLGYAEPPGVSDNVRIVRMDADAQELRQGREPDVALLGDPARALAAIALEAARQSVAPKVAWLAEARERDRVFRARWTGSLSAETLTGRHVVEALRPLVRGPEEPVFLVDGGNIGQWAHGAGRPLPEPLADLRGERRRRLGARRSNRRQAGLPRPSGAAALGRRGDRLHARRVRDGGAPGDTVRRRPRRRPRLGDRRERPAGAERRGGCGRQSARAAALRSDRRGLRRGRRPS